jgi:hypothetical protein
MLAGVGLVEWIFGLRDFKAQWDHYDADARAKKLIVPILEEVASATGSPKIVRSEEGVELWGTISGYASRVRISSSGGVDIDLRYEEDQKLLVLDAEGERVGTIRLLDGELNLRFQAQIYDLAAPARTLIDALSRARDILVARGMTPSPLPGTPLDPNEPLRGYRHLETSEKQARRLFLAESIAKRVGGRAHAVRGHDEVRIDVQWTENEEELRIDIPSCSIYPSVGRRGHRGQLHVVARARRPDGRHSHLPRSMHLLG